MYIHDIHTCAHIYMYIMISRCTSRHGITSFFVHINISISFIMFTVIYIHIGMCIHMCTYICMHIHYHYHCVILQITVVASLIVEFHVTLTTFISAYYTILMYTYGHRLTCTHIPIKYIYIGIYIYIYQTYVYTSRYPGEYS